jgi:hypothetical protein
VVAYGRLDRARDRARTGDRGGTGQRHHSADLATDRASPMPLLTIDDVAAHLGVSPGWVYPQVRTARCRRC